VAVCGPRAVTFQISVSGPNTNKLMMSGTYRDLAEHRVDDHVGTRVYQDARLSSIAELPMEPLRNLGL
jgi:hypothetical protein